MQQQAAVQQQYVNDVAEVVTIDKQLTQFAQLDWQKLIDEDPVGVMKLQQQQQALQAQRYQVVEKITQKQQQDHWNSQQAVAKSIQEGNAVLQRDIKGWSPELASKLMNYGASIGIPQNDLANITNPVVVKLLHKAYLHDQGIKQPATKEKPEATPPVTRLKAVNNGGQKDPSKMSDKEFAAWRQSQIKNRK